MRTDRVLQGLLLVVLSAVAVRSPAQSTGKHTPVVFEQAGFPTIDSEPVSHNTLKAALGNEAVFADLPALQRAEVLKDAPLLVLPYGSAVPAAAWSSIEHYLRGGGNLLVLGGQPLRVPVAGDGTSAWVPQAPQDSYSHAIGFRHSYPVPALTAGAHFAWRTGYSFLPSVNIPVQQVYVLEGRLDGLGYLEAPDGTRLAAPVIVADSGAEARMPGTRIVALPFHPVAGYWDTADGGKLLAACAHYAMQGATHLTVEAQYATLRPGELPAITLHHRAPRPPGAASPEASGEAHIELRRGKDVLESKTVALTANGDVAVAFRKPLARGFYTLVATWTRAGDATPQEFAENGFYVEDLTALEEGNGLGTHGDFLTLGGKPFFPVGVNYFSTEANGWDFSGPRNAAIWERDFADMQRHNVNFVRTGVWDGYGKFLDPVTGHANERFLRNLEGFLAAAHRHNIAINFTFFAFSPHTDNTKPKQGGDPEAGTAPPNPYLDTAALKTEYGYVLSVVHRFGRLPWLCYDLINEPSFSNPRLIFHGNVPNNDPAELAAWHTWLGSRYPSTEALADAWRVTPDSLRALPEVPLPTLREITYDRYGNPNEVRAFDYNLFAQDMFSGWVHGMVSTIRGAGSTQLVNVGQDEGGVTNRVLNQFYATAGVSFTTNHTYWNDDALLWDSVVAKRVGLPNITGETGYQPAWNPDGGWRYDELTGTAIEERKWIMGFAAGSSGALQWDWDREVDFGMQRSDGSAKVWQGLMRDLGAFATAATPYATGLKLPEVAIVLPESLQLSVYNAQALEAQQTAVRALYYYNRVEAYAVAEHGTETLGSPKLILLPSAYGLSDKAWSDIEAKVRAGATLLISGPFSADEHLHPNNRAGALGLDYTLTGLQGREETLQLPTGAVPLQYTGLKTTTLDKASLPNAATWSEIRLGEGRILFSTLPVELNSRIESVAAVYAYALKVAGVAATYHADLATPGVLICPTRLPEATLYVLSSETGTTAVRFTDVRSGRQFAGTLAAGRSAMLLVSVKGDVLADYHWQASTTK